MKEKEVPGNSTLGASNDTDPDFIISIVNTVLAFASLATGIVGVYFIVQSGYTPPPIPVGYIIANVLILFGSALVLQAIVSISIVLGVDGCSPKTHPHTAKQIFFLLWGAGIATYGVFYFLIDHPFVLSQCPCPAFHATDPSGGCVPCPGFEKGVCEDEGCVCGNGVCSETTATCDCEFNWQIDENMTCTQCSDRTKDSSFGECSRCKERFKPDSTGDCSLCRNGYVGSDCKQCHPNFEPRRNDDGSIFYTDEGAMVCGPVFPGCKDDQPAGGGRSGTMCEPVENCAQWGDVNAKVRQTNADAALAQPATFTFNGGQTCLYDHDCEDSYNCRGICSWGKGGLEGALCLESETDCGGGVCEGRVCALERRVGSTDCECSRAGFQQPRCQSCPGFNKIWSETTCAGRGSCQALFVDVGLGWASEYDSLQCVCGKPLGTLTEFPKYSGEYCEKIVGEDGAVQGCAEGYFGDNCEITCEGGAGWGGAAVCSSRGACKFDGAQAYCDCDSDTKPGGIGFFAGKGCEACAGEFATSQCSPCPGLQVTSDCGPHSFNISTNPVTCFNSCNIKTCDDGKNGNGYCF